MVLLFLIQFSSDPCQHPVDPGWVTLDIGDCFCHWFIQQIIESTHIVTNHLENYAERKWDAPQLPLVFWVHVHRTRVSTNPCKTTRSLGMITFLALYSLKRYLYIHTPHTTHST